MAVDAAQAGPGDLVLAAREGNTARQVLGAGEEPLHAVVLGVVDAVDLPVVGR
jgi:microcompartment protein CcmK/EutM